MFTGTVENTSLTRQRVNKSQSAHSLALFEVALFKTVGDQRHENTGDNHNPTRQRGIFPHTASNAKAQSLADAAGCDSRKVLTRFRFGLVTEPNMALYS